MKKFGLVNDENLPIIGAICGDILGSSYEFHPNKSLKLPLYTDKDEFTDDTICTIAITDAIERGIPFDESLRQWCRKYPRSDYGGRFGQWIYQENGKPYNSWGNGSAMRVSAAGAYSMTVEEARQLAKATAEVTHNHPEGIKGAEATAAVIQLAKSGGMSKWDLKEYVEKEFGYDLSQSYEELQKVYEYSESCQNTFPAAFISFYEGWDYEDVIRHAIALGGDADTLAAIAGSMAAAFFHKIGYKTLDHCLPLLPQEMIEVLRKFRNAHSAGIKCNIKIKDIKLEKDHVKRGFEKYVEYLFKPKMTFSELGFYITKRCGYLPQWDFKVEVELEEDNTLKSISAGGIFLDPYDEPFSIAWELDEKCKPDIRKIFPQSFKDFFQEKGYPDSYENPEGFIRKLIEEYPELTPFIEEID